MLHIFILLNIFTFPTTFTDADEIVKAVQGIPVHIPCPSPFKLKDKVKFQWKKGGTAVCTYDVQDNKTIEGNCDPRFNTSQPFQLYIKSTNEFDSGQYNCTMTRIIPPPTVDKYHIVDLEVKVPEGLILEKQNCDDSSCIQLLCTVKGFNPQDVNFTWIRQRQGSLEPLLANHSFKLNSSLILYPSDWEEGDNITCKVSHSANYSRLSASITLFSSDIEGSNNTIIFYIGVSLFGGVLVITALGLCIFKYRKKFASHDSVTYNNQVYENFSFSTQTHLRQTIPQNPKNQCVYEN